MRAGKDPDRGSDLSTLIAPDRRKEHAALLVVVSMIAGALLVLFAEHVADVLNEPPPSRMPHLVEQDRIAGDETMRLHHWMGELDVADD